MGRNGGIDTIQHSLVKQREERVLVSGCQPCEDHLVSLLVELQSRTQSSKGTAGSRIRRARRTGSDDGEEKDRCRCVIHHRSY